VVARPGNTAYVLAHVEGSRRDTRFLLQSYLQGVTRKVTKRVTQNDDPYHRRRLHRAGQGTTTAHTFLTD